MTRRSTLSLLLVASCLAALALLATPAAAEVYLAQDRFFAGVPAKVLVYGAANVDISGYEVPILTPHEVDTYYNGDRIELNLTGFPTTTPGRFFAYRIDLPNPKAGISRLIVKMKDGEVLLDAAILVESGVEVTSSRTFLTESETLQVRTRFHSSYGEINEAELVGNKIRVELGLGCALFCPIFFPTANFDLETLPIGPLPAGEYQLEVWRRGLDGADTIFHQEKVVVVPAQARLRGGRFNGRHPARSAPWRFSAARRPALGGLRTLLFFRSQKLGSDGQGSRRLCHQRPLLGFRGRFDRCRSYRDCAGHHHPARERQYRQPAGAPAAAITDIQAFACNPGDLQ